MLSTLDTILKVVFIVFFFGFCVFIHEFGHLLVALWCGLHVEKFSIGMGPKICGFRWRNIDFVVSWLPFGGFVSLPQLDPTDAPKASDGRELPQAGPGARAATAFAGPLFNVLFGFLLATIMCFAGLWMPAPASSVIVDYVPETLLTADGQESGTPNPEWLAGLRAGDRIFAINGRRFTGGMDEFQKEYVYANKADVTLEIARDGQVKALGYPVKPNPLRENLGFPFFSFSNPVQVREVTEGPMKKAGLQQGDLLLAVNDRNIASVRQMKELLHEIVTTPISSGAAIASSRYTFTIERAGKEMTLEPFGLNLSSPVTPDDIFQQLGISFGATVAAVVEDSAADRANIKTGDCFTMVETLGKDSGEVLARTQVYGVQDFQQAVRQSEGKPLRMTLKRSGKTLSVTASAELNTSIEPPIWQIGIILSDSLEKTLAHPSPWQQFSTVMGTTARTLGLLFSPITRRVKSVVGGTSAPPPSASIGLRHMSGPVGILMMLWYKLKDEGYRGGFAFIILITFSLAFMNLLPLPVLDGGHILFSAVEALIHRRLPAKVLTWIYNIFACLLIALMLYITVFDGRRGWRLFRLSHPAQSSQQAAPEAAHEEPSQEKP